MRSEVRRIRRGMRPGPILGPLLAVCWGMAFGAADGLAQSPGPAAGLEGSWAGKLSVPGAPAPLTLVFHLSVAAPSDAGAGGVSGTMDSPDQGVTGIPIPRGTLRGDTVNLEIPAIQGGFEGVRVHPDTLVGTWVQSVARLPLVLVRTDPEALATRRRPQDPIPPLPYEERPFTVLNEAAGVRLEGTLTLPIAPGRSPDAGGAGAGAAGAGAAGAGAAGAGAVRRGPFPAVVLISGSGAQNRDSEIFGHRPFLVLADHLTRAGVAVLRLDDRGVGGSEGTLATVTSEDLAGDVLAAVRALAAVPEVDPRQIGLVGHSEGGLIAPWVETMAAPGEVAFLVFLAGPGLPGRAILEAQGDLILRTGGAPEPLLRLQRELQGLILDLVVEEPDPTLRAARLRGALDGFLAGIPAAERTGLLGIPAGGEAEWIRVQVQGAESPWLRAFLLHDPVPVLEQVRVPVLALNGALDLQVPPRENLDAIEGALRRGGNPDVTARVLPELNHLFQTAPTGHPSEYGVLDETFAPAALLAISEWILARVRLP
jgi:uncharacterized protein